METNRIWSPLSLAAVAAMWLVGLSLFTWVWPVPVLSIAWSGIAATLGAAVAADWIRDSATAAASRETAATRASAVARSQPSVATPNPAAARRSRLPSIGADGPADSRWMPSNSPRVAIAGVGDIGSRVAVALVQSSFTRLSVADMDVVEWDNLGQSAFRSVDVGQLKVSAIEGMCREINPDVEVRVMTTDLCNVPELELGIWLGDATMLILSVDDPVALLRLHDHFYSRIPTVAAGIHEAGASGHVVYTIPWMTACLRCALGIRKPKDLVQIRGNSANPDDVQRIAGEAASVALKLADRSRTNRLEEGRNVLFLNNRQAGGFRSSEAHWLEVERRPDCRVCRGGR